MTTAGWTRLDLVADLRLEIDGSPVTVTADGAEVLVSLAAPDVVVDAVLGLPRPVGVTRRGVRRRLAGVADATTAQGVDVVVTGPAGVLLTVGPRARGSRLGRLATGSRHVDVGGWAAVRGPAATVLRRRAASRVGRSLARLRR